MFHRLENLRLFSTLRLTPDFLFQAKSSSPNKLLEIKITMSKYSLFSPAYPALLISVWAIVDTGCYMTGLAIFAGLFFAGYIALLLACPIVIYKQRKSDITLIFMVILSGSVALVFCILATYFFPARPPIKWYEQLGNTCRIFIPYGIFTGMIFWFIEKRSRRRNHPPITHSKQGIRKNSNQR